MKKALIVLLLLAFVAGGLFAQFSFSGRVNTGVALYKFAGVDDMGAGLIGRQLGTDTPRAELNFSGTNEAGTAGVAFRLRAADFGFGDPAFRYAYGWLKGLDGMLEVRAGRIQGSDFDTMDTLSDGLTEFDGYGLQFYINPVDMFSVGLGVRSGELDMITGGNYNAKGALTGANTNGWFGFGVHVDKMVDFAAQMSFGKVDEDLFWDDDDDDTTPDVFLVNMNKTFVNALVSASINAIPDVGVIVSMAMNDLADFSDTGSMTFYEEFSYSAIENVSLNLAFVQSLAQWDNADLYFRGAFWATYAMGNIVPRLDLNFVMGGTYEMSSFYIAENSFGKTYNKEQMFITFIPSVQLKVTNRTFVDIGFIGGVDLTDDKKAAPAFTQAAEAGFNFGAFVDVLIQF